jgi:hypothetical protein
MSSTPRLPLFDLGDEPVERITEDERRRDRAKLVLGQLSHRMQLIAAVERLELALKENTAARLALVRLRRKVTHD